MAKQEKAPRTRDNSGKFASRQEPKESPARKSFKTSGGNLLRAGTVLGIFTAGGLVGWRITEVIESDSPSGYSVSVTEIGTPTPSEAAGKPTPSQEAQLSFISPAQKDASGNWIINNPDGQAENISSIDGFTPDASLVLAPEWEQALPLDPAKFADFQKSLNDPDDPLVGWTDGENDQSDNVDYRQTKQGAMYSWNVFTGEELDVPGIGHLKGGPGEAVMVMAMNISDHVINWGSNNPVMVKHGFTGFGRIWDENKVVRAEQGISSHFVNRLGNGVTQPGESGFVGQCDLPTNCDKVLVVSVIYRQWGNYPNGTPRLQFQLLRVEQVSK